MNVISRKIVTLMSTFVPFTSPILSQLLLPSIARAELVDDDEEKDSPVSAKSGSKPSLQQTEDEKSQNKTPGSGSKKSAGEKDSGIKETAPKDAGTKDAGQTKNKSRSKNASKTAANGVVKFWGKSLSGFREQGSLMLEQDVVVTQNDIRIEADKATIFFEKEGHEVTEVHALGSVKFSRIDPETGQPILAEGQEAFFNNSKRIVIMKGDPILRRGTDTVRGKVIQYDLTNGWVKADRVEGVVQPDEKKAVQK